VPDNCEVHKPLQNCGSFSVSYLRFTFMARGSRRWLLDHCEVCGHYAWSHQWWI